MKTFQSMPLRVTIKSLAREFSKDIKVRTCPKMVNGKYKVENWKQGEDRGKNRLSHLKENDFAKSTQDGLVDFVDWSGQCRVALLQSRCTC